MYGNVCSGCKEYDPNLHVDHPLCDECVQKARDKFFNSLDPDINLKRLTFEFYCGTLYSSVLEL